jgi:SAM-dependent methyltransferase
MTHDAWLERWLPLIAERAGAGAILELGCGPGEDTDTLTQAGHRVVALDVSADAIDAARARVPAAEFHHGDVREPFPLAGARVGVVIASLSLHYFSWPETAEIVTRIRTALRASGVLVCRLNSTNDHNFGASGHKQIEPNYYWVKGKRKRFFDAADVARLFSTGWIVISSEERTTSKYARPKVAWEIVAQCTTS